MSSRAAGRQILANRRELLLGGGAVAALWALGFPGCGRPELPPEAIARVAPAARFGRRYLESNPEEADPEILRRHIEEGLSRSGLDGLRARIAEEFGAGDVVEVDGWLLARSEARLYALAAMVEGGDG